MFFELALLTSTMLFGPGTQSGRGAVSNPAAVVGSAAVFGLTDDPGGYDTSRRDACPCRQQFDGASVRIRIARADSNATSSWPVDAVERQWRYIVIHHSATDSGSVESIHQEHSRRKDRAGNNWLGIGYHFVIGNGDGMKDGEISPTFRWKQQIHGAHSGSAIHNGLGIGICVIGNFEQKPPSSRQVAAVQHLLIRLTKRYRVTTKNIIGHNAVKNTACPGRYFPLNALRRRLSEINTNS